MTRSESRQCKEWVVFILRLLITFDLYVSILFDRSKNNHRAGLYLLSLRCFLWLALPLASLLPTSLEHPWVPLTPSSPKLRAATQVCESLTPLPFLPKGLRGTHHLHVTQERMGGLSGCPLSLAIAHPTKRKYFTHSKPLLR